MMIAYQALGWPRHVIVDPAGVVRFHGFSEDERLGNIRKCIDDLIKEQAASKPAASPPALTVRDRVALPASVVAAREARRERSPRLALDPQGRPWVVYFANPAGQNEIFVRPADGPAAALTKDPSDDYAPDCVFDSAGKLWVAWCGNRSGNYEIYIQPWGGDPAPPIRLTTSAEDAMRPRLAAGPAGRLAVTYYKWSSMNGVSRDRDIFLRLYDPKTGWGPETRVSPLEPVVEDHTDPDVAFTAQGEPLVVWSYDYHPSLFRQPLDTDQPSIFGALVGQDGVAGEARLAGTIGRRLGCIDLFPSVARDGAGALWCAWDASSVRRGGRGLRLARWEGNAFAPALDLRPGGCCSTPELTPASGNGLLAAWTEYADHAWSGVIARVEDGKPTHRASFNAKGADVRFLQAVQAPDGKIWAAWEECNPASSRVVLKDLTGEMK